MSVEKAPGYPPPPVERVGGDYHAGEVRAAQQRLEPSGLSQAVS
jgi:hypothetical protein